VFVTVCILTAVLSPLGMASMHTPGSIDMDDDKVYGGVVGKGKCPSLLHMWGVHSCGGSTVGGFSGCYHAINRL